jgi:hypothetical protein
MRISCIFMMVFIIVIFSVGLGFGSSCDGEGATSYYGSWYDIGVWDETNYEATVVIDEQRFVMISRTLDYDHFVLVLRADYQESNGSLTLTPTDGYMVDFDSWFDDESSGWNTFLAELAAVWGGDPPYVFDSSVSGNEMAVSFIGQDSTFTQISATLNQIGAWSRSIVWDTSNIKYSCIFDRLRMEMASYDMDSGGECVWAVSGTYDISDGSMTFVLKAGYDGVDGVEVGDTGWSDFITNNVEPYWGIPPYIFQITASESQLILSIEGEETQLNRL